MTNIIAQLEAEQAAKIEAKRTLPEFSPGDTLRAVSYTHLTLPTNREV